MSLADPRRGPDRHLTDGTAEAPSPTREDFEVLTDALCGARPCRECGAMFATRVPSAGNKWTDCCGPCLRAMGCM